MPVLGTQRVVSHYPVVDVTVWSQYGHGPWNLTSGGSNSFRSFSTHKDMNTPYGQFVIELTAVPDRTGKTWRDKIHAMDYVEIRAGDVRRSTPLPMIMRGFVDSVQESIQFDTAGRPTRTITVAGRDWGKLLSMWQVQYLWPIDPLTAFVQAVTNNPIATTFAFGIPMTVQTGAQFAQYVLDKVVAPVAALLQGVFPQVPMPTLYTALPSQAIIAPSYVENFTGSYWNLLSYYQSPPFGELFLLDQDDEVQLVFRLAPLHDYYGQAPDLFQAVAGDAGAIEEPIAIPSADVAAYTLGRTDNQVYTYFITMPDSSLPQVLSVANFINANAATINAEDTVDVTAIAGQLKGTVPHPYLNAQLEPKAPANPIYLADFIPVYGFRPLTVNTPWLGGAVANGLTGSATQQIASDLCWWLYQVNRDNADWLAGTITLHGNEYLHIGRYLQIVHPDRIEEFYITSVDHKFVYAEPGNPNGTWISTLGVSRGRVIRS
jgi:hypothetical protein